MSKAKTPKPAKAIIVDVAHPGTSAPSDTSKPIITHRPIMKDPMVVTDDENADASGNEAPKQPLSKNSKATIKPLHEPDAETDAAEADEKTGTDDTEDSSEVKEKPDTGSASPESPETPETETSDEAADEAAGPEGVPKTTADKGKKSKKGGVDAETAAQAEQDAKVQKLIDSKKYFLPINAVEHRRSVRFVAFGVALALILAVAWVDVALDAGLIHLGSVKPVTHIFSN